MRTEGGCWPGSIRDGREDGIEESRARCMGVGGSSTLEGDPVAPGDNPGDCRRTARFTTSTPLTMAANPLEVDIPQEDREGDTTGPWGVVGVMDPRALPSERVRPNAGIGDTVSETSTGSGEENTLPMREPRVLDLDLPSGALGTGPMGDGMSDER